MRKYEKTIITAAVTGAIHVPSMSPYLPVTPQQIIEDAVSAHKAGAAVVHIHTREPQTGEPSSDVSLMASVVNGIKSACDAIICVTTGASQFMTLEERLYPVTVLKPELASCNAGSVNFVMSDIADKLTRPLPWEADYLLKSKNNVFTNTFHGLEKYVTVMNESGTKPEFEIYDMAMINNIAYFINKGLIKTPVYVQFVLGVLGGLPATVENLVFLKTTADKALGDYVWSVAAAGRKQFPITAAGLAMGGNIRVGLEDNLFLKHGVLAKSSGEQVAVMRNIAETFGHEIASPAEAREILSIG